ncbi:hypothetical protein C5Z25_01635 [Lactobacillus sp. CBA3605]|uniref:hypothetical protein n=1 Tax=Lactobacillus sp. CBA3605 TaxID=2099788 RepID=UPI000CFC93C9|nr:hypothetical protein [Lactobacillus sp. CBA3605]AVK60549.1 hypothetical protein C5Z25_01635 [Lactobacillus sp. CBA3605]
MARIDHKLLLAKIQDAEGKYDSVTEAPSDVLAKIQKLAHAGPEDNQIELTRYEVEIMKRRFNGEISEAVTAQLLGHSNSWLRRRMAKVVDRNYLVMEDGLDDEATETHKEVSTQKKSSADATTRTRT